MLKTTQNWDELSASTLFVLQDWKFPRKIKMNWTSTVIGKAAVHKFCLSPWLKIDTEFKELGQAFFAVQQLDSVAKQQPEPHHVDISKGVLLLCPNLIYLPTLYTSCETQQGVPRHCQELTSDWFTVLYLMKICPNGNIWQGTLVFTDVTWEQWYKQMTRYISCSLCWGLHLKNVASCWGVLKLPCVRVFLSVWGLNIHTEVK